MEKGQTARRYVNVWLREAVNNAGDDAIAIDRALLCLFDGRELEGESEFGEYGIMLAIDDLARLVTSLMAGWHVMRSDKRRSAWRVPWIGGA